VIVDATADASEFTVGRVYAVADDTPGPDHGLTGPQRDALRRGVDRLVGNTLDVRD